MVPAENILSNANQNSCLLSSFGTWVLKVVSISIKNYPSTNFCFRAQKISGLTSAFQQSELAHQFLVVRFYDLPDLVPRDSGGGFPFQCNFQVILLTLSP